MIRGGILHFWIFNFRRWIRDPKGITYVGFFFQIESNAKMIVSIYRKTHSDSVIYSNIYYNHKSKQHFWLSYFSLLCINSTPTFKLHQKYLQHHWEIKQSFEHICLPLSYFCCEWHLICLKGESWFKNVITKVSFNHNPTLPL